MKPKLFALLSLCVSALLLLTSKIPVLAQAPGATHRSPAQNLSPMSEGTPFVDDFNDGIADGWKPISGTWTVLTDVLGIPYAQVSDIGGFGNRFTSFYTGTQFADFTLEVEISSTSQLDPGAFNVGVALRGDGSDNYYRVIFHPNLPDGQLRVEKIVNGIKMDLMPNQSYAASPGPKTLTVTAKGNAFSVQISSEFSTTWHDDAYSAGCIGLTTENGGANFDNVKVTPIITYRVYLPLLANKSGANDRLSLQAGRQ